MSRRHQHWYRLIAIASLVVISGCGGNTSSRNDSDASSSASPQSGFEVKLLFGSALGEFCDQAIATFNQQQPRLESGEAFYASCEAAGSGDVVDSIISLAEQLQAGTTNADSPDFPTLLSVDGEIYHGQLRYRMEQLFPGQSYIPEITDAPLLANSPMVFMAEEDIAEGLQATDNVFQALTTADTHQDIDPDSPPLNIHYVHTAPTRSNSGLQTLVAQFASVSGKRPEELTIDDINTYAPQVEEIQQKITRYGVSTSSLATSMVQNGPFWASVGSVYESSVIAANQNRQPDQPRYQAVYPSATFTSNMRAILPDAPWVSDSEKAAAEQVIEYLRSPDVQAIATNLGLRPGIPGVALGANFSTELGVNPQASYDSYRPPQPDVVDTMLRTWEDAVKKPSLVAVVIDSSGSMEGNKLPAVQNTLRTYINNLGPRDQIALIDFDDQVRSPVLVEGTPDGQNRGLEFVSSLQADGGTRLYDAALFARNWLQDNFRENAINAVLILTDGVDSSEGITLQQLDSELQSSGFESDQRIAFFTVGYGQEGEFNPDALKQIADFNGGYYSKGNPETISQLMADLQLEF
ncbi:MAG TPA: extracellular solute-binding protein [Elainellaceae cyanobacterium]